MAEGLPLVAVRCHFALDSQRQFQLLKLLSERQITLELSEAAREMVADAGYDPVYGARPLKRALQRMIQDPLANRLLKGEFHPGDHILVDEAKDGNLTFAKGEPPQVTVH